MLRFHKYCERKTLVDSMKKRERKNVTYALHIVLFSLTHVAFVHYLKKTGLYKRKEKTG